jgi:hypothetical protein
VFDWTRNFRIGFSPFHGEHDHVVGWGNGDLLVSQSLDGHRVHCLLWVTRLSRLDSDA